MKYTSITLLLISCIAFYGCGGGGGSGENKSGHFDSLAGVWEIDAQNLVVYACATRVGGFTDSIFVKVDGNVVTASGPLSSEGGSPLMFTGHLTNDGFVIESHVGNSCGTEGKTNYKISVSGIPETGNNDSGNSSYSFESICGDNMNSCAFTVTGTATHVSE